MMGSSAPRTDSTESLKNTQGQGMSSSSSSSLTGGSSISISAAKATFLSLLPGAAQGATTVLLGHPFDTAKTRLQADTQLKLQTRSSLKVMRQMVRHEGAVSLYRGVTPPLAIMGSKRGLQFALWEQIKKRKSSSNDAVKGRGGNAEEDLLKRGSSSSSSALSSSTIMEKDEDLVGIKHRLAKSMSSAGSVVANNNFLSGAVSGAFGTLLGCPMHVIKIQTQNVSVANAEGRRWNAFYCTRAILRDDGVRGLYRGFKFHVLKDTVFAGTYLGTYEKLRIELSGLSLFARASAALSSLSSSSTKAHLNSSNSPNSSSDQEDAPRSAYSATEMISTSAPSAAATAAMAVEKKAESSSSSVSTSSSPSSSTRGGAPAAASSNLAIFSAGVLASCFTWIVLYPLDTLKTAVQAKKAVNLKTFMALMAANPLAVYRGFSAALVRAGPVSGAAMVAYESLKTVVANTNVPTSK